jgi:UDP-N-acetylglucosamine--N-acetylmuramyl-(pentapeptide) pyrophosphoryl-undecaprenol N-acetylglucosamine transferase
MRVLVAAGGSGGHVYPALAVFEELRAWGALTAACWLGSPTGIEAKIVRRYPWIDFQPLSCRGLPRSQPWRWPATLLHSGRALGQARGVIEKFRPQVVLGMGGYPSFAPVLAAHLAGIPTAIHEQNARLGLVNKLLLPLASRVLLSFPHTHGAPPPGGKVRVTGNPLRRQFLSLRPRFPGRELLVVGGSQGSRLLVEATLRAAPTLARLPELRLRLVVGQAADPLAVRRRLAAAGLRDPAVERYTEHMAQALGQARLVISRAGGTAVAELAATGRPAILVPWSRAAGGHQRDNALALARTGGCVLIGERQLASVDLGTLVARLWEDEARLKRMGQAVLRVARPQAARLVAQELLSLARGVP